MSAAAMTSGLAVSALGISKSFGGTKALKSVDLTVDVGQVHGLVGENGSGKSTFVKILAGAHTPERGSLEIYGQPVDLPMAPGEPRRRGLSFVHQDLGLIGDMTVLENLRLNVVSGHGSFRWNKRRESRQAVALFDRFGRRIDPDELVRRLSMADRAYLAIVRALESLEEERSMLGRGRGVLVLDEATVSLPADDKHRLFEVIRRIADHGGSVLFISHYLDDVLSVCDQVTVFRDGEVVASLASDATDSEQLIRLITGNEAIGSSIRGSGPVLSVAIPPDSNPTERAIVTDSSGHPAPLRSFGDGDRANAKIEAPSGRLQYGASPVAMVQGLCGEGIAEVHLTVAAGEILGLTGLLGSGYELVPEFVFGARRADKGALVLGSDRYDLTRQTPARSISAGIVYVPANRQGEGIILGLDAWENLSILALADQHRGWWVGRRALMARASSLMSKYDIRPWDPRLRTATFSGGNQQKLVLAKWLSRRPRLVLLSEPTQGVDVGARKYIFDLLRSAADDGTAVICASGDQAEIADLCDRALVFGDGRLKTEITGAGLTKKDLVDHCYTASSSGSTQLKWAFG